MEWNGCHLLIELPFARRWSGSSGCSESSIIGESPLVVLNEESFVDVSSAAGGAGGDACGIIIELI